MVGDCMYHASQLPMHVQLLNEARGYSSLHLITSWPLVSNKAQQWWHKYSALKKSGGMKGTLEMLETVWVTYCRLILLPFLRLPIVRTPLKVVDYYSSKFVLLFEDSMPRLRDRLDPMEFNGELIFTMMFLPMNICITLGHRVLESLAGQLVTFFPPLKEAHRNFDQKGLIGQWITLLLMTYLYLPLQFLSHPSETIHYFIGIPSRIAWALFEWNVSNVRMIFNESLEWLQWTSYTFSNYILFTQNLAVSVIDYWYYIVFRMTGLEEMLAWMVKKLRDYLKRSESGVANIINTLGQSALSVWLGDVLYSLDLAPVHFIMSVWNDERREQLKTRPRALRPPTTSGGSRRQNSPPPEPVAGPSSAS